MWLDNKIVIINFWHPLGTYSECVMRKLILFWKHGNLKTVERWKGINKQRESSVTNFIFFITITKKSSLFYCYFTIVIKISVDSYNVMVNVLQDANLTIMEKPQFLFFLFQQNKIISRVRG